MTNQKPIEPLPSHELVQQWDDEWWDQRERFGSPIGELPFVATRAAQWGYAQRSAVNEAELQKARDEQLDQCCNWLDGYESEGWAAEQMREAFRPKPKSQAEQALETLHSMRIAPVVINGINVNADVMNKYEIIRAALERLRELESSNG